MIKLDVKNYDTVKDDYFKEIVKDISAHYQTNSKQFFNVAVSDFFETGHSFDVNKVKNIINVDLIDINNNDELLVNYLKTGFLIHYSDFQVDNALKINGKDITRANRYQYRIDYVNEYYNDWLKSYLAKHQNYYKNAKNFKKFINDIDKEFLQLNNEIDGIINYSFISSTLRHQIINASKVTVCPYCNRQYISYYQNKGQQYTTADLDHFYPKGIFALLSLSLQNFIPSCQICNQRFKKKKIKKILYPFKAGFESDAKFNVKIHDFDSFYGLNDNFDLQIAIDDKSTMKEEITNNKEMFHLEALYQHHKPYVQELLLKKNLIYNDSYLAMMQATFANLNLSKQYLDIFLYGYSFDENLDRDKILEKLTKDILEKG